MSIFANCQYFYHIFLKNFLRFFISVFDLLSPLSSYRFLANSILIVMCNKYIKETKSARKSGKAILITSKRRIKKIFLYNTKNRLHFLDKFDIIQKQSEFASVAQQVEQLIRNQQVAGPNPATSSKLLKLTKASQKRCLSSFIRNFSLFPLSPFALTGESSSSTRLSVYHLKCNFPLPHVFPLPPFPLCTLFEGTHGVRSAWGNTRRSHRRVSFSCYVTRSRAK